MDTQLPQAQTENQVKTTCTSHYDFTSTAVELLGTAEMHSLISGRLHREPCLSKAPQCSVQHFRLYLRFYPNWKEGNWYFLGSEGAQKAPWWLQEREQGTVKLQSRALRWCCVYPAVPALHCKSCTECGEHTAGSTASSWTMEKWAK